MGDHPIELEKIIHERHSTRAFLDKPVPRETIEKLLLLSTKAPSAINLQPWEFTVVMREERECDKNCYVCNRSDCPLELNSCYQEAV